MIGRVERLLFDVDQHPVRYVLRALPLAMLPAFATGLVAMGLIGLWRPQDPSPFGPLDGGPWDGLRRLSPGWLLFQVLFAAPVLETLLMAALLLGLTRVVRRRRWVVLASAGIWAGLHGLSAVVWGLCVFWAFAVFSCAFLAWRQRSRAHALLVPAAIHALNNAVASIGLLLY